MKARFKQVTAWVLLVCFIPAIIGFAFIHHHCMGCNMENTEALLSFIPHHHSEAECFCNDSSCNHEMAQGCCHCHRPVETKDSDHDKDTCVVDIIKLDISSTTSLPALSAPRAMEINTLFSFTPEGPILLNLNQPSLCYNELWRTDPPLKHHYFPALLCVFRL